MGYYMDMQDSKFFVPTERTGFVFASTKRAGYNFELNAEGDIIGIEFQGGTLRDDFEMFQKIAPFVRDGSFLEMTGEDGALWRWVFKDGECQEINAVVTWPDTGEVL